MIFNRERFITRILEIFPGFLTWFVLTSPLWLALRLPFFLGGLILFLDIYWFYKAIRVGVFSFVGYRKMQEAVKTDWIRKLRELEGGGRGREALQPNDIWHLVVIPTWKESLLVLDGTFKALAKQNYPYDRTIVLLAQEEREGEKFLRPKREALRAKYGRAFNELFITVHPADYPGHHVGPGSNRTYAVQRILHKLRKKSLDPHKVILTTLDADFVLHPDFLAALTYKYLTTPSAHKKTFTGVFWYYNNFWQSPAPTRIVASGVSFWQLSEMTGSDKYMNFSSHSINLQSLIDMNFWVVDKVNDDGEFYWRAYYHFAGDYSVIPHFMPIYADVVQRETLWKSLKEQYLQLRRWAYGVEHMPMILKNYFRRSDIPWLPKTDRIVFLIQGFLSWATMAVLISFGSLILELVNPSFAKTVFAFNLPSFSRLILTLAFLGLLILVYIHERLVPPRPKSWNFWQRLVSYLEWGFVPLVILTFGTLPAVDAQTRLMLGRYMEFRVTRKYRSEKSMENANDRLSKSLEGFFLTFH